MHQDKKIVSFDVFDTCVSRMHAHPRDLFYDLGLRVFQGQNEAHRLAFAKKFQRARIRAEKIANWRTRKTSENASLRDVYSNFHWLLRTGLDVEELVNAELALELESIYAIGTTAAEIEKLRAAGRKIIFVSDMYLPSDLLKPMLRNSGIMAESDTLYVSCDSGLTKHSGRLFDHVLSSEKALPHELIHTGDNVWADIAVPKRKGIETRHFANAFLTPHEARIAGEKLPRSPARSYLAALSRRSRLAMAQPAGSSTHRFDSVIHGVVVPLLVSYVLWVIEHAKQTGIRRLYFVARDGEVLYKIAKELNAGVDTIDLRYLHGSRRAWLSPSISMGTTPWKNLLITAGQSNSRKDIVARAGLTEVESEFVREALAINPAQWNQPLGVTEAERFLEAILSDRRISGIILESAARKREIALAYFKQEGLLDDVSWALVDAGWSLNSQAALKRILSGSTAREPKGYYLALGRSHLSRDLAGEAYPFIPSPGSFLSRRRVIIEHCFMPSVHATTQSYEIQDGRVTPVFGAELRGNLELEYASRLHEAAISAARMVADHPEILASINTYRADVLRNAEEFLRHPSASDAEAMAPFGTIADLRHEIDFVEPLCRPLGIEHVWRALSMTLFKGLNFKTPSYMWLEGSCALSPAYVRLPLRFMLWVDSLKNRLTPTGH